MTHATNRLAGKNIYSGTCALILGNALLSVVFQISLISIIFAGKRCSLVICAINCFPGKTIWVSTGGERSKIERVNEQLIENFPFSRIHPEANEEGAGKVFQCPVCSKQFTSKTQSNKCRESHQSETKNGAGKIQSKVSRIGKIKFTKVLNENPLNFSQNRTKKRKAKTISPRSRCL